MHPVLAKLNYKAQPEIAVINAPDEFLTVVDTVRLLATIVTDPQQIQLGTFVIAFVKNQAELDTVSHALAQRTKGDSILWIAYPKGSSRKYTCDFNRDTGWAYWANWASRAFGWWLLTKTGARYVSDGLNTSKK